MADQLALFDDGDTKELDVAEKGFEPGASHPGDGPNAWSQPYGWGYLTGLLGYDEAPFKRIPASDAIKQAAFLAGCDLLAQDAAKASLTIRRRLPDGGSQRLGPREHPLARLFWLKPCRGMTWHEWKHMLVYHIVVGGNAYILPRTADRGRTFSELIPLFPSWVTDGINPETLNLLYTVRPSTLFDASRLGGRDALYFREDELFHCRTRYVGGVNGVSTLNVGNRVLERLDTLSKYEQRLFNRDAQYRGIFEMPKDVEPLSQPQYDALVASLQRAFHQTRTNPGKPIILEQGMTFKETSSTVEESEFVKLWDQALSEVARLLRIPPHKFWHLTAVKYENQETHERNYVAESLLTRLQPFEEKLDGFLLSEEEQLDFYIEFDREELYQADMNALHKRVVEQWKAGLITRDQALMMLGQNPSKNGKVYQVPANTQLLDENNVVIVGAAAGSAGQDGQGGDTPPKKDIEEEE